MILGNTTDNSVGLFLLTEATETGDGVPMRKTYLFLDFDGVVCDSVPECFLSSHIAYNEFLGRPVTAVPLETKKRFYEYRPFMRSGEDYFLLQKFIEEGKTISVQEDFDRVIRALPPGTMETYKKLFINTGRRSLGRTETTG